VKTIATWRSTLVRVHLMSERNTESTQEVKHQTCNYKLLKCPWKRLQAVT